MNSPLRVRHLIKGLGPGGAERLVVSQAVAQGATHYEVAYLIPAKNHLVPLLAAADVETVCLNTSALVWPGWIWRLRRLLRSSPTDVLHVHSPAVAAIARVVVRTLPRRLRPAVVSTEHNRWPRHHGLTRLANRLTIRLDRATIAVSNDVKATIAGVPPERVQVIVHGIDMAAVRAAASREAVRAELGVDEGDVVVVCVANLRREKSLDVLVEAARLALGSEPRLRYFLVGQGPLAMELDGWIASAGIGERFTALGYREDAPRIMSGADIFTLSSAHEGLPVAIMEALTLGLPVVATAAGGIPAAAGSAGVISPIADAAALAAGHLALSTADARAPLSAAALVEAERFSITRAVAEIDQVYADAIAATSDRPSNQS